MPTKKTAKKTTKKTAKKTTKKAAKKAETPERAQPVKKAARTAKSHAKPSRDEEAMASGRQSLAVHFAAKHAPTAEAVAKALRAAMKALRKETKGEHLYAVALYTSGISLFGYVGISANTEEGLTEVAESYLASHPGSTLERERTQLRWNACDWAHHDFADVPGVMLGRDLSIRSRYEDAAIWEAFAEGLARCDDEGLFGRGQEREKMTLAILCGDMDARFFMKGVRRLNPPRVVGRTQREWRAQLGTNPMNDG